MADAVQSASGLTVENFGGNVTFQPGAAYRPRSEGEVLEILAQERGKRIRAVGRLHSWSEAVRADDVLIDLRFLNHVQVDAAGTRAVIGAGAQIKHVLKELQRRGLTLPSVGLVSEQTIAGATATGTHGSGKHSLSHYLSAVRLACYDPETGQPVVREVRDGDELRAARCSLGCLGIVLAVEVVPRPQYQVEEWFRLDDRLEEVLAAEPTAPLQQFFLLPWLWTYLTQHRREVERPRSWLAPLYRFYWFLVVDLGLHLVLRLLVQTWRSRWAIQAFYRNLVRWTIVRGWRVVDRSQSMLIMEHELFRHIEIEVFVTASRLGPALDFVRRVLIALDGGPEDLLPADREALAGQELLAELHAARGSYTHHYPICVRRVLPDDTLISMASGDDEPYYALSFISYARPAEREGFFRFARFLAASMALLFDARCHWGKVCPLPPDEIERLYPHLPTFRTICDRLDPGHVFRNRWIEDLLFPDPQAPRGEPAPPT